MYPHAAPTIFNRTKTMNTQDLICLGVPAGEPIKLAHEFIQSFIAQYKDGAQLEAEIFNIVANPPAFFADELRAPMGIFWTVMGRTGREANRFESFADQQFQSEMLHFLKAALLGLEPRQNDSESFVLPLHHKAKRGARR